MEKNDIRLILEDGALSHEEKRIVSETIADIAHQLRTPLTTINILVSLLQEEGLPEKKRSEYLQEINLLLSRLEWLITALLRMSRIDAGTVDFRVEQVAVSDLIAGALEPLMVPIELREQTFEFSSQGNETFFGDLNWCKEALGNILKNCMEHTPKGGMISATASQNDAYTEIIIEDTGTGIDPADMPYLFQRYYRGKSDKSGSGIGLPLARMIIEQEHGTIRAENREEGGARFILRFYRRDLPLPEKSDGGAEQ